MDKIMRVELKAEDSPTKEQIDEFKKQNPTTKIRVQKNGKVFIYLEDGIVEKTNVI